MTDVEFFWVKEAATGETKEKEEKEEEEGEEEEMSVLENSCRVSACFTIL